MSKKHEVILDETEIRKTLSWWHIYAFAADAQRFEENSAIIVKLIDALEKPSPWELELKKKMKAVAGG